MKAGMFGGAVSVALLFGAAQASAATLLIDDFNGSQIVSDAPFGSVGTSSTIADGSVLGGTRSLSVQNTARVGAPEAQTVLEVADGLLAFSNRDKAQGRGTITYDGGGAGLGSIAIGANPYFFFEVDEFDRIVDIMVNGTDGGGNTISYSERIVGLDFDPRLFFSEFTGADAFDFTDVTSLMFTVDSSDTLISVDGSLDSLSVRADDVAPIPLPASALLLLGGVGGLSLVRSRRRKA